MSATSGRVPDPQPSSRTRTPRWIIAGFVLAALSLVLLALGLIVLAIGIVAIIKQHIRLGPSDRVLVLRWDRGSVGDIVVFHPPRDAERASQCRAPHGRDQPCPRPSGGRADVNFIKRIVAGPGDALAIDGHVVRNGKRLREAYIRDCDAPEGCSLPKPITVPPDHYFMMGDNRGASDDSRFWGPVPRGWIVGRVAFRYYPFGDAGGL